MALATVRRALSQRFPLGLDDVKEFLRQELIPMLRELRESVNSTTDGPVLHGHGAPVAAPTFGRALYIDLDGGALTTLYVWNGLAWEAK